MKSNLPFPTYHFQPTTHNILPLESQGMLNQTLQGLVPRPQLILLAFLKTDQYKFLVGYIRKQ